MNDSDRKPARLHLPFLDGIRGLAAVWVMLSHLYGQYMDGLIASGAIKGWDSSFVTLVMSQGKDGVAVFIVLSGFCLMLPIVSSGGQLRGGLPNFFRRRGLRILPPYYASIALSLLLTYSSHLSKSRLGIVDTSDIWRENFSPGTIVTHLLLVHNWFPQWAFTLNTVLWSVAAEWQIYFLFALLLLPLWGRFALRFGPIRSAALTLGIGLVLGYLPLLCLPRSYDFQWTAPWYLGLFALGMAGAVVAVSEDISAARLRDAAPWGWLSLGAILLAYPVGRRLLGLPQFAVDPFIGIATVTLILLCLRHSQNGVATAEASSGETVAPPARRPPLLRLLESPPVVLIGAFSYSLYLTHGSVQTRLKSLLLSRHLPAPVYGVTLWALGIGLALAFAYLFYLVCERPFLAARRRAGGS